MHLSLFRKAFVIALTCLASVVGGVGVGDGRADCTQWVVGPGQQSAGPNGGTFAALQWDPDGAGPLPVKLVVGGSFSVAGTVLASNIAVWDGANWTPLGNGFNGAVRALALYNNQLIAAGSFTASGATTCNRVARWTGADWQPLGAGVTPMCIAWSSTAGGSTPVARSSTPAASPPTRLRVGTARSGGRSARATLVSQAFPAGTPSSAALAVFAGNLIVGGDFGNAANMLGTRACAVERLGVVRARCVPGFNRLPPGHVHGCHNFCFGPGREPLHWRIVRRGRRCRGNGEDSPATTRSPEHGTASRAAWARPYCRCSCSSSAASTA